MAHRLTFRVQPEELVRDATGVEDEALVISEGA